MLRYFFKAVIITALLLIQTGVALGQRKEINENQIPETVRKAIETDFPYWKKIHWYAFNQESEDWAMISRGQNLQTTGTDKYVVQARGRNITTHAIYDKDGKLLRSKTELKNTALPGTITQNIASEFSGWTITGDRVVIRNFDENLKFYVVTIQQGKEKQTLYFDYLGNRTKRTRV